jgi:hypothetical protein
MERGSHDVKLQPADVTVKGGGGYRKHHEERQEGVVGWSMAGGSTVKTFSTVSSRGEGKQDVGRTVTVVGR